MWRHFHILMTVSNFNKTTKTNNDFTLQVLSTQCKTNSAWVLVANICRVQYVYLNTHDPFLWYITFGCLSLPCRMSHVSHEGCFHIPFDISHKMSFAWVRHKGLFRKVGLDTVCPVVQLLTRSSNNFLWDIQDTKNHCKRVFLNVSKHFCRESLNMYFCSWNKWALSRTSKEER